MLGQRPEVLIARTVGIVCIALGFVLGMHGLDYPDSMWLPTALGLIVTGMVAQLFALIRSLMRASEDKKDPKL
ncbi:MAG: hypothetical protein NPIRA02_37540 [Nitrospirales bacterium]|nr:MAG: hypothetical protein NPIRA02_37540 [Nitrospirales bacterium]